MTKQLIWYNSKKLFCMINDKNTYHQNLKKYLRYKKKNYNTLCGLQ